MQYNLLGDQLALGITHDLLPPLLVAAPTPIRWGDYLIKFFILILKGMDHVYSSVGFTILNIFGLALYLEVKFFFNDSTNFLRIFFKLRQ